MTKLSSQTIDILKNFSTINFNLVVKAGQNLSTISEAKNIMAIADISESLPCDFGIYDLSEFISMLSLLQDPELEFTDSSVQFKSGRTKATYRFADQNILTSPKNKINMPSSDLNVVITADMLTQVRKAAGVLGHSVLSICGDSGLVTLAVIDPKNSAANSFSVVIDDSNSQVSNFDLQFLIANLKVIPGDYDVKISAKRISHWTHKTIPVQYYIALEEASTFNK